MEYREKSTQLSLVRDGVGSVHNKFGNSLMKTFYCGRPLVEYLNYL